MIAGKRDFPMNDKQQNFAFEVAQEIGVSGKKQRKPGLTAPSTGADALQKDALTKTDHGNDTERFVPKF
ncbi:hypothetical protein V6C27_02325 [Peptococcaceae bacterium 1198_IL3148]